MKILKRDLDKALKQLWSPQTCILAQAAIRLGVARGRDVIPMTGLEYLPEFMTEKAQDLMNLFDRSYTDPKAMKALRAKLPIKV